ncbi:MAG: radical SAM protein [Thermoprotei archaeon]|nr:MAG: radical SAM protein [Thermoprotei archaeon]
MSKLRLSLKELLYKKILLKKQLEEKMSKESILKAKNDYHAKKRPRPCGFTVHSVIGCSFRCIYCYIPDMGFSFSSAKPYGLTGEEIVYALLENPYFLPGRHGSYIAIGSVGEPFHPVGVNKTMEYVSAFSRYLGNPLQFSTKMYISNELAKRLASFRNISISSLITIITTEKSHILEPNAPSVASRLESIRNLKKNNLHPVLFLRPIIPGVNDDEISTILKDARRYGAEGVVIGGFRVTREILERFENSGLETSEIRKRLKGKLADNKQISIYTRDLKEEVVYEAKRNGLVPFLSACCANTYIFFKKFGYGIPCAGLDFAEGYFCTNCPVQCKNIEVVVDVEEIKHYLKKFFNIEEHDSVILDSFKITIKTNRYKKLRNRVQKRIGYRILIETAYRKKLVIENE